MQSPSPSAAAPAHGSSRATGGILRGKCDKFSMADADGETAGGHIPVDGKAFIFAGTWKASDIGINGEPEAKLTCPIFETMGELLPALARKFDELAGMYYFRLSHTLIYACHRTQECCRPH